MSLKSATNSYCFHSCLKFLCWHNILQSPTTQILCSCCVCAVSSISPTDISSPSDYAAVSMTTRLNTNRKCCSKVATSGPMFSLWKIHSNIFIWLSNTGIYFKKYISLRLIVSKETINNIYFTKGNPILFDFRTAYVCYTHSRYIQDSRVSSYGMEKGDYIYSGEKNFSPLPPRDQVWGHTNVLYSRYRYFSRR